MHPNTFKKQGLICQRQHDASVNIPQILPCLHSPDGFEWGYGGSGPADLARNVVEKVLRTSGFEGPKARRNGKLQPQFEMTDRIYQDFKWNVIANIPPEGGVIPYETLLAEVTRLIDAK